jgi:hypothetical protein
VSQGSNAPKVLLAELREYVSRSSSAYFVGYMGKAKLVLLQDRDAACTGNEVARWNLIVEQAPPREERRPANDAPGRAPLLEHHPTPVDNSSA